MPESGDLQGEVGKGMTEETPLKRFISNTLKDIESALPKGKYFAGNINFDVTAAVQKSKGGKFSIFILDAGAKKSEITTHRISFSITSQKSAEENIKALRAFIQELVNSMNELDKASKRKMR